VRLTELRDEMNAIYAAFPDLRSGTSSADGDANGVAAHSRRRRKGMSAAQRKASECADEEVLGGEASCKEIGIVFLGMRTSGHVGSMLPIDRNVILPLRAPTSA